MSEPPTTPFHRTMSPPAFLRLRVPADYGPWQKPLGSPRQRLDVYERLSATTSLPPDPLLEAALQRRLSRRERDGRLGPPPEGWNPDARQ